MLDKYTPLLFCFFIKYAPELLDTPKPNARQNGGFRATAPHHSRYFRSNKTEGYRYSLGASRRDEMRNTRHKTQMIHKRSTALERSVKIFYWRA